jgi:nitrite reductase (NADH) small subunit
MVRACTVDDVPIGEGRAVTIAGRRVALFRTRAGWYALDAACPHLGGPLADGIVSDQSVICPLHERRFELATGAALSGGCGVSAHRVTLVGNAVFVSVGMQAVEDQPAVRSQDLASGRPRWSPPEAVTPPPAR